MFEGSLVAIVTPFKNGKVDGQALKDLIERQIAGGTQGIVPCGTTGESATLSHEEHTEVISIAVEACRGRVPVLAGTGSNSTREAIELTRQAEDAGADGSLLITPYYNKPNQDGLIEHFTAVAKETRLPIILYNVPGRTAVNMLPKTVERLAKLENIVGIKEASGSLMQISEIVQRCGEGFTVLSGDDGLLWPILAVGGRGVISVTANVLPEPMARLVDAAQRGDMDGAKKAHYELLEINDVLFIDTNPIQVKTALALMGLVSDEFRLPLVPLAGEPLTRLKAVLKKHALI
jgi:4-hydroxy-tetrahydrodipicolinate synthase